MSKGHPLTVISQLRHYTNDMMAALSQLRTAISDDFTRELDALSSNIQHLQQSTRVLHVQVETRMIEKRFTRSDRLSCD